jgi:hypothetical protein
VHLIRPNLVTAAGQLTPTYVSENPQQCTCVAVLVLFLAYTLLATLNLITHAKVEHFPIYFETSATFSLGMLVSVWLALNTTMQRVDHST